MAKFCVKCGTKLDMQTGLCPKCDSAKIKIINTENSGRQHPDKTRNPDSDFLKCDSNPLNSAGNKKKILSIVLISLASVVVVAGVIAVLFVFDVIDWGKQQVETTSAVEVIQPTTTVEPIKDTQTTEEYFPSHPMDNIKSIEASSYLDEPQYGVSHTPDRAADGDLTTAWVEGEPGEGVLEYITYTFNSKQSVDGFSISNGYQLSIDHYNKNSRPSRITVLFSDGTGLGFDIIDTMDSQTFSFGKTIQTDSITFVIVSVYSGYQYEDTCISELTVF